MPDSLMLFAAGFGTRMGELTRERPKPLIPVGGVPLIDHALELVEAHGVSNILVNAHYKADMISEHLHNRDVHLLIEEPDILDTGGGVIAGLPNLRNDPVYTMNSDAVWSGPNPLDVIAHEWRDHMQALLLCVPVERVRGRQGPGDLNVSPDGLATWGKAAVYSGVQIIRTSLVANWPDDVFSLRAVWEKLEAKGALNAAIYPGLWCDVGHPDGILIAEKMLEEENG